MELVKRFLNHRGVDLKSSDLLRPPQYAGGMLNAQYSDGGSIEKRTGYQAHAASAGGYGTFTYRRVDAAGAAVPEVLTVDQNLYKLAQSQITVGYSGVNTTCVLSFFLDETTRTYKLQVLEGSTLIVDEDVGKGFDEASPVTLADLKVVIDAVPTLAAVISGPTTVPAAFLKIVRELDLTVGDWVEQASYWTQIYSPTSNPFSAYYAVRYDEMFENVSSIQLNNVIYLSNGYSELYKYDGQGFYRAGLPTPGTPTAVKSAGAITGLNYVHRIQYVQYDAAGNIVESNLTSSVAQSATAEQFTLTIPNVLAATGFNTNGAIVNGAQVSVTVITVDSGHTLQVGDTAYFFDSISADYVTREVTAIAATTITVAGAAVTVADNAVISNNLTILIWRSKTSAVTPSAFYLVAEIPNNSFAATQTYVDNIVDNALGELLLPPSSDRSTPPKGKYISQWNGQMFIGGIIDDPTSLKWSDVDGPEYFPANTNQTFIEPGNGDIITGIAANNEVFTVHGNRSFTVISGDIGSNQIRIETRARDVGCAAHATLQDIDGVLCWMSPQGPRQSAGGQIPVPLGPAIDPSESNQASRIDPDFDNAGKREIEKLRLKRATSFNDTRGDKYVVYVPAETGDDSLRYPNEFSRIYAYDRVRDAWLVWSNIGMAGGMTELGDETYFVERRYSDFESDVESVMYRKHTLVDAFDYADNTEAIAFDYSPQWEFLGEPSVLKDPLSLRLFSLESVPNNQFDLVVEQEINFQNDAASATFTMSISGGGYGFSPYGTSLYSDPTSDGYLHPLSRQRHRSIRPRFKNEVIHEAVLISGWEIEFSTPYRPEFKP